MNKRSSIFSWWKPKRKSTPLKKPSAVAVPALESAPVTKPTSSSTRASVKGPSKSAELKAIQASVVAARSAPKPVQAKQDSKQNSRFDCSIQTMASDVSFEMVTKCIDSWERDLKAVPGWKEIGGELLLRKMFELEPECIEMFGFPSDTRFDDPELKNNAAFMKKGIALVMAVDMAVSFLGPDLEPLESELVALGERHVALECKPKHWPMVGEALFYVFEQALGKKFTPAVQKSWLTLYRFLGYHMIVGLIKNGGSQEWS
jgi:hemoglobin-like flavoprotein